MLACQIFELKKSLYVPTTELASTIIRSISGDPNDEDAYKRHLALFESALSRELCTMQKSLSQLSENLRSVEARQIELGTSMDELKQLIQNLTQTSFCIKGSIYESHKTVNMTYMDFDICSHKRNPTKESVRVVVARVLTAQVVRTQAYKFDAAVRFANASLSDLQTEEGIQPYRSSPYVPTTELASTIIRSISGDPNDEDAYKRHLALFVSYPLFRSWVDQYYSNIDEEDWGVIMKDDASYSYPSLGHGLGPAATAATIATTSIADAGPIITTAPSYTTEGLE
ncbi:hypothetical protein EMCRGX_G005149 [Ephydatia muelleri]